MPFVSPAMAGPPFVLDDPEPTDNRHWEIYAFANGASAEDGSGGEAGLDFNYGAAPDLQLTAVLPVGYSDPSGGPFTTGLGNIELAAKYRFLHQDSFGVDVAVFPRVFLPATSAAGGEQHASFFLPIWLQKDWGEWSAFGGGGCELNNGGGSQDFCIAGGVLTREVAPHLRLGIEAYHQTADARGGRPNTSIGFGGIYDISEHYHLLGYANTGVQNRAATNRASWYTAILWTF
jgi:hypothetical protein